MDVESSAATETLEQAIVERAVKWMEESKFLVGLLQELLKENEELRERAAALERDLEGLRDEKNALPGKREDLVELAPQGGLDMASARQMKIQDYIEAGKSKVVVDLEGVDYIDSAGLGELVRAMKRAREAGGDLRLCCLREGVLRIFEVTGLTKAMAVFPTREEAAASWD